MKILEIIIFKIRLEITKDAKMEKGGTDHIYIISSINIGNLISNVRLYVDS